MKKYREVPAAKKGQVKKRIPEMSFLAKSPQNRRELSLRLPYGLPVPDLENHSLRIAVLSSKGEIMKHKLSAVETISVASMLFGMFFGAGNLIFPVHLGQLAGNNLLPAFIGFIVTGVGLPMLGIAAFGITRSSGLKELASKVNKKYAVFFTTLLYLTIGPCFAIPRCATTSFTVGLEPLLGESKLWLTVFCLIFFGLVLFFSLKPNGILTWIGKIINPLFLVFICTLILAALLDPLAAVNSITPDAGYQTGAFFNGFLEGYNTMDAIASLAFGIVVINVIMSLGLKQSGDITRAAIHAGVFSCLFMGLIYLGSCVIGAQSRGLFETSANGGIALAQISGHYFGNIGQVFLAVMVTLACLKTSIGLVTSLCEAFADMFTGGKHYSIWAVAFVLFSFFVANLGLTSIISYAVPFLMFIYPLVITLILLAIFGNLFGQDRTVYIWVTFFTFIAALFDFFNALGIRSAAEIGKKVLPFFDLGLGWLVPAFIGLIIGLILRKKAGRK